MNYWALIPIDVAVIPIDVALIPIDVALIPTNTNGNNTNKIVITNK
jgi:hypothetical protein